ncbi:MAG: serine/threonine-protein kinase [Myxococcaceae bacterium]|nr:serine/threonine-protein kinase [Myxococcaceae bacterium]
MTGDRSTVETEPEGVTAVRRREGLIGRAFDGFVTTGALAEGGMGVLLEAHHPVLGTLAVVKVLQSELSDDPLAAKRMLVEGQTLSALQHRNVVRVFGFGHLENGRPWLLFERLVGQSLGSIIEARGGLPLGEALPLMEQAAAGLEATHQLSVLHRDLKPDNLFVVIEPDGARYLKLIDFGIAKPEVALGRETTDLHTATGQFVGTVAYGAPELFTGAPFTPPSDVYALGCVFFEMLTGQRPFRAPSLPDLARQHLEAQVPRPRTFVRTVPARLDALVAQMLAKQPSERPTLATVRETLRQVMAPATPRWAVLTIVGLLALSAALLLELFRLDR